MTAEDIATLAEAMAPDADDIVADVEAGRAELLRWDDGSRGVIRLETTATGRQELVLVAGAGRGYRDKVRGLLALADAQGWQVRTHTRKPGLFRMLEGLGFAEAERVFIYGQ